MEIWEPKPGTLWATPSLLGEPFTFIFIFFERISGGHVGSTIVVRQWKNRSCGAFKILTSSALVLVLKNTEGLQSIS
jgi:hypothetical protein